MSKTCQVCGKRAYSDWCVLHKPRKPIRQRGKEANNWNAVRNNWILRHGLYHPCYICGKRLNETTLTLDHVIPRSNAKNYANRHDDSNIRPACWSCNSEKGSKHIE